jgi:hypothetical protein
MCSGQGSPVRVLVRKKRKERKEKKRESGSDAMNIAGLIKQNFQTALSLNQLKSGLPEL